MNSKRCKAPACLYSLALLTLSCSLYAQEKKELSFEQAFKAAPTGIYQPLPNISGWADAGHYLETRTANGKEQRWKVNAATGQASPYTPAGGSVAIRDNDIYYTAAGVETRLTNDTIPEQNPTLSPNGKYVAFTRRNDLYSVEIATKKETRHTTDGSDVILNGWASWVYYEEILGRASRYRAFWWSPDSKHIAYMRFDDSKVPVFPIYGEKGQHGYVENTHYPKAGDPNPAVRIGIVPAGGGATVWASFNEQDDQYFGAPFWTPDGRELWVQWMNREQNNLKVYAINPQQGGKKEVYDEKQATWIDWLQAIHFLDNGQGFLLKSDKSGWAHLYWYNMDGSLKKQLTSGNWTVNGILEIDQQQQLAYFTGRKEASTRVDLYQLNLRNGAIARLTSGNYSHTVSVSPGGKYFITTSSNLNTPARMTLANNKGKVLRELGNNKGAAFNEYNLAATELRYYKTRDGLELPMTITMPLHVQPGKKYPVLISVYGGPNAGRVFDTYDTLRARQWLAQEGLVQVAIDNRSAGHLGKTGMNYIHRKVGIYETEDFIDAAKWLAAQPWADAGKICITGGSFGGYMTCMALTYGADVFTHGISSYPVTDWQLYDSHYTERYMDSPAENPEGYRQTAVMTYADKYKGLLRLIHGTMDDNVHMQQTLQLVNKLEDLNKHFELMLYPGERHGWRGKLKEAHSNAEAMRFYYQYLLEKPLPREFQR